MSTIDPAPDPDVEPEDEESLDHGDTAVEGDDSEEPDA